MNTITVSWTAPTTRIDGSPMAASEIAGFKIFESFNGGATTFIESVGSAIRSHVYTSVAPGTHKYYIEATDTFGQDSPLSGNSQTITVPVPTPPAPNSPFNVAAALS